MNTLVVVPDQVFLDLHPNLRSALSAAQTPGPEAWRHIRTAKDQGVPAAVLYSVSPAVGPAAPLVLSPQMEAEIQGKLPWEAMGGLRAAIQRSATLNRPLHEALLNLLRPIDAAAVLHLSPDEATRLCQRDPKAVLELPVHLKAYEPFLVLAKAGYPLKRADVPKRFLQRLIDQTPLESPSLIHLVDWREWKKGIPPICMSHTTETWRQTHLPPGLSIQRMNEAQLIAICKNRSGNFRAAAMVLMSRALGREGSLWGHLPLDWYARFLDRLSLAEGDPLEKIAPPYYLGTTFTSEHLRSFTDESLKYSAWGPWIQTMLRPEDVQAAIERIPEPKSVKEWQSYAGMPALPHLMERYPAPESVINLAAQRARTLDALPEGLWSDEMLADFLLRMPANGTPDSRQQIQAVLKHPRLNIIRPDALVHLLDIATRNPGVLIRSTALQRSLIPQTPGWLASEEVIRLNPALQETLVRIKALPGKRGQSPVNPQVLDEEFSL